MFTPNYINLCQMFIVIILIIFWLYPQIYEYITKCFYYNSPKISNSCLLQHHCFSPLMNLNFFKKNQENHNGFYYLPQIVYINVLFNIIVFHC